MTPPFNRLDPRPEEWYDPDPRPEEWYDPDPRPEEWYDPDPRPEEWYDPDPRPEEWYDPDPRPEEWYDPDPAVRRAKQSPRRRGKRWKPRGRRRACPPSCCRPCCARRRVARRRFPLQRSGKVILRLSPELELTEVKDETDLYKLTRKLGLRGLRRVLKQYRVDRKSASRLVDVYEPEPESRESKKEVRYRDGGESIQQPRRRETIYDLELEAAGSELPPLHSLDSYWRIDARDQPRRTEPEPGETRLDGWKPSHRGTVRRLVADLNQLPEVDLAYRELAATDPLADGAPGDLYAGIQEYLERSPIGIDARWLWRHAGTEAGKVRFVDLEQGWIRHDDIDVDPDTALIFGDNRHDFGDSGEAEGGYRGHHGTAVLGQILGKHDAGERGIAGISPGTRLVLLTSHWSESEGASGNVANAIRHAIPQMDPGDVLLLEVQRSYLPTEVDEADRDAIRLAVAHGIIVIEAAGNGNANLDRYVNEEGERILNRRHPQFRESGALMVGAARAELPHDRLSGRIGVGSNFGSRIDCFAHGDRVVTAGYGDMNDYLEPEGVDEATAARRAYSAGFGGTSGAAPIIAGAALLVQELRHGSAQTRLSPWEMRRLLADPATGTRQGRGVGGRIGIMPDLKRIVRERLGLVSDLYLSSGRGDEGRLPVSRRADTSPDLLVLPKGASPPDPLDDTCHGLEASPDDGKHCVRVRLRNRGLEPAERPVVRAFRGPVATLLLPADWHEIEGASEAALKDVSGTVGGIPAWSGEIGLGAALAREGEPRRFSLIAQVRDPRDEEEPLPPGEWPYFSWRSYLSLMRWSNSVAACNVHRVTAAAKVELDFEVTGTPDRARTFDFEIVRRLPRGVELQLEAPAALASRLRRGRLWKVTDTVPEAARVRLIPAVQPRLRLESVRLLAGARFPCSFRLTGAGLARGHSLAIRQLYRDREVGRITWRFSAKSLSEELGGAGDDSS